MLVFIAELFQFATAQEQPRFIVRIVELTSSRYTCTALTPDHQLEQLTAAVDQFRLGAAELRRGSASDEDVKRASELLEEPEIRNAGTGVSRFPMMVMRDGKAILVLGRIEGQTRVVQFVDTEGKKSTPVYLKGFEAFADDVHRRKLPRSAEKSTANCKLPFTNQ